MEPHWGNTFKFKFNGNLFYINFILTFKVTLIKIKSSSFSAILLVFYTCRSHRCHDHHTRTQEETRNISNLYPMHSFPFPSNWVSTAQSFETQSLKHIKEVGKKVQLVKVTAIKSDGLYFIPRSNQDQWSGKREPVKSEAKRS